MKESTKVQEFLNCSFDAEKMGKFDSSANLWFVTYGIVSLSLAILPIDNFALQANLGFIIFVVSGVLYLAYEAAKHYEQIDFRISIFRLLRWYTLMLFSALFAVFGWWIAYERFLQYLGLSEPAGLIVTFTVFSTAFFLVFQFPVKWLNHRFLESIRCMLKDDDELIIEVATQFMLTGRLSRISLFLVNSFIFLAILEESPFYTSMISSIVSQPFTWVALAVMLPIMLPPLYKRIISKQVNLIRQIGTKKSNNNGSE